MLTIVLKAIATVAKAPLQRSTVYIQTLKRLGLDPDHPPTEFSGVYSYALVEYGLSEEGAQSEAILRLLDEPETKAAFRDAFDQWDVTPLTQAVDQRTTLSQDPWANEWNFVAQAIQSQGIDVQREVSLFFAVFVSVVRRSQTPKDHLQTVMLKQEIAQQLGELRSQLAGISNLAALPEALSQTLSEIKLLAAGDGSKSDDSPLAAQLRGWFDVLGYGWEPHSIAGEDYFEWIITIPVRRRRYDRVLVRGVMGEAGMSDLQDLQAAVQQHNTDEGWLVSNRRVSSGARKTVEEYEALSCYTLDELLDEDADFAQYLEWLEQEIRDRRIDQDYIPLGCSKDEIDPKTHQKLGISHYGEDEGWIEGYVDQWLADPSKEHLSVLGEFGTGKTWFALHYAWVALQKYQDAKRKGIERPRLPLVIPLRDYAKAVSVESLFSEFFFRKHEIPLPGYSAFERLNRMGKLLLIFDGFDEMAARTNRQAMIDNFWELARVVVPGAKAILTCRTEHFPDAIEGRQLLGAELKASTANLTGEPPQFEVLELAKFSDRQIGQLLGRKARPETVAKVTDNPQLLDLARRPVMVDLILEALPEIEAGKPVDMARVYLYAVTQKMKRDIKSDRTFTSLADKLYFLCELSWEMLSTDQMSLNYRAFPARLQQMFEARVQEEKELDHWRYDMMGQTMLIRNSEGDYSPAHRSLLEFFVAYKIVASLGAMAEDFVAVAREQSGVDGVLPAQEYTWEGYFRRSLGADGDVEAIAPLKRFRAMSYEELLPLLRDAKLTQAVLELASPMLDGETMRERLLPLIWETRGQSSEDVGYFGGNIVQLMLGRSAFALVDQNLSKTVLKGIDFTGASLQTADLQKADLSEASFDKVLGGIQSIALSPLGTYIVIGDSRGIVQVWDLATGQSVLFLVGHSASVNCVAYSPDGKTIASGSDDKSIRLWSVDSGNCICTLNGHSSWIQSLAYSPNGDTFVSGSHDKTVKVWSVSSNRCLYTLDGHTSMIKSVAYSPDGAIVVSGSSDRTARLWSADSGEHIRTLENHSGSIRTIAYSPDGESIAMGDAAHAVRLWSVKSDNYVRTFIGHSDEVRVLAYSQDGDIVASGGYDYTVKLWSVDSGECLQTLQGHSDSIMAMACSFSNRMIVSGGYDHLVKLWSVDSGECLRTFKGRSDSITSVAYSPDGESLALGSDNNTVKIWSTASGVCIRTLTGHSNWINSIAYSPDGSTLASGSDDYTVKLWSTDSGKCICTLEGHSKWVQSVAYSPDGAVLASGSSDRTVRLWSMKTRECTHILEGHTSWIFAVAYSPDGTTLVSSGSTDRMIKLWCVRTGTCTHSFEGHLGPVVSVVYSPDSTTIASGSFDNTVKLWSVDSGECIHTFVGHSGGVRSVAYSPDGTKLASGSSDKTMKLWCIESGECIRTLKDHSSWVLSVAYSPDGTTIASGSSDETIQLHDVETGTWLRTIDERGCAGMDITGVQGLTAGQRTALKLMGAIDHNDPQ